jgi:hypothetical protein
MKQILLVIAISISWSSVYAYTPKIGDTATYLASRLDKNGELISKHSIAKRITSYSQSSKSHLYTATLTFSNGDTQVLDGLIASGLKYNETMRVNCASHGTVEIVTVDAGTFSTCKIDFSGDGSIVTWYGDVSFGVVKEDRLNSDTNEIYRTELTSFR